MDWAWLIAVPTDVDVALAVALVAGLSVFWWQLRRWRIEPKAREFSEERPLYEHLFKCKPMLNRMQREREILFTRHRAPIGSVEARSRRVAAARAKLREQELLHEES